MFTNYRITKRVLVLVLIAGLGAGVGWLCRGEAAPPKLPKKVPQLPVDMNPWKADPSKELTYEELNALAQRLWLDSDNLKKKLEAATQEVQTLKNTVTHLQAELAKAKRELAQEKEKHKK